MGFGLYLESQKQAIANSVAMQNSISKRNPQLNQGLDVSSSFISIFSDQVKAAIRTQAAKCNETTNQILLKNNKNVEAVKSCSEVNQEIAELQTLTSWAGGASQEIASLPGISNSAITSIKQNLSSAINFGVSAINETAANANEALSKINTPQNKQIGDAISKVQNNINNVAQDTITNKQKATGLDNTQNITSGTNISDATLAKTPIPATDGKTASTDIKQPDLKSIPPVKNTEPLNIKA